MPASIAPGETCCNVAALPSLAMLYCLLAGTMLRSPCPASEVTSLEPGFTARQLSLVMQYGT